MPIEIEDLPQWAQDYYRPPKKREHMRGVKTVLGCRLDTRPNDKDITVALDMREDGDAIVALKPEDARRFGRFLISNADRVDGPAPRTAKSLGIRDAMGDVIRVETDGRWIDLGTDFTEYAILTPDQARLLAALLKESADALDTNVQGT